MRLLLLTIAMLWIVPGCGSPTVTDVGASPTASSGGPAAGPIGGGGSGNAFASVPAATGTAAKGGASAAATSQVPGLGATATNNNTITSGSPNTSKVPGLGSPASVATVTTKSGVGPNGYPYCTNGSNTGSGYGWDTSVTDPNGSHSCLVPSGNTGSSVASSGASGGAIPVLNANAPGNASFSLHDYGAQLQTNKNGLAAAADAAGATAQEKALVIAMAMQETTLMDPNQRDASKDGTASANCSILNMNYDMISKLGYSGGDNGASLNSTANLSQAVGYLLKAFRTWGIPSTLNYQRGGSTAFQDGTSYGVADYRNAIQTIYNQIAADPSLETDGRRVEIYVGGV